MKDLIVKLEAATEGSRELDADIYEAIGCSVIRARKSHRGLSWCYRGHFPHGWLAIRWEKMGHFTTSLDAALTLVPDGCRISVTEYPDGPCSAVIYDTNRTGNCTVPNRKALALGMCIAALKAREASMGPSSPIVPTPCPRKERE